MDIDTFFDIIKNEKGYDLDDEQKKVIYHGDGPLWVVAGPGSGKTEVLVLRTLKLIFIDEINPASIIITTFTEKAANNLFERILKYSAILFDFNHEFEQKIDLHDLRIGTLHSLCNDIMLKYKFPQYENYRLLDDLEQYLFIYEHADFVNDRNDKYLPMCREFDYLFDRFDNVTNSPGWDGTKIPNKWRRTKAAISIFDRIVEDLIELDKLKTSEEPYKLLFDAYNDYLTILEDHKRCDFAHLQKKFLEFLNGSLGSLFVNGDNSENHPGIKYVLVDEYQDTNPIQEEIYFKLAKNTTNLCIVGDDDQALYRFRGGTVDCMVTFDKACKKNFGIQLDPDQIHFLNNNYRSHEDIVKYYNTYIKSFDSMKLAGARVENKPDLNPLSNIEGDYPAVAYITERTRPITAESLAFFVQDLLENNIIEEPCQCALLMRSSKENRNYAGPFVQALNDVGIKTYNPRSKGFLVQEEVSGILGAFISIVDPDFTALDTIGPPNIKKMVKSWVETYEKIKTNYSELENYVNESLNEIYKVPCGSTIGVEVLEIFYRLLAFEPFKSWRDDVERTYRLGRLSKLFETYSANPYPGYPGTNRGKLKRSGDTAEGISFRWRTTFYYSLIGFLLSGLDDPEDEVIISPPDRMPIMTVHQAKGLEFPFVFVYGLNEETWVDVSIKLENDLLNFRQKPTYLNFTSEERAEQDHVRFFYVAYSRAQHALIHLIPDRHFKETIGFINKDIISFKEIVQQLRV